MRRLGFWIGILFVLGLAILLICCRNIPPKPWETESFYIDYSADRNSVVVFVHGIFGDSRTTWKATNGFVWPEALRHDPNILPVNVFVYSFPSPYLGRSFTLDDLVNDLNFKLEVNGIFKRHKRVIFVCHSMGGIVTRSALRASQA